MTPVPLEQRLASMGAALRFPATERLADDVVAAIRPPRAGRSWGRRLLVAVAAVLLGVTVVAAMPASRHAVARWLGLERLPVHVVGGLSEPARRELGRPLPLAEAAVAAGVEPSVSSTLGPPVAVYAPGGRYVAVRYDDEGRAVLITTLPGRLDGVAFRKLVESGVQVTEVEVGGRPGIWITGEPHVFMYVTPDGSMAEARPAADTLAWQDGDVIVRVEADIPLDRALEIAATLAPAG